MTTEQFDFLREQLKMEAPNHIASEHTIDLLLSVCQEINFESKVPIIDKGDFDTSLWITATGSLRVVWFNGSQEKTFGFGGPGTMFISPYGYSGNQNAFFYLYTCEPCTMLRVSKENLDNLLNTSHKFALWMFHVLMRQMWGIEHKIELLSGSAKERVHSLLNQTDKDEVKALGFHRVMNGQIPQHVQASYLGMTPSHLAHLVKEMLTGKK